MQLAIAKLYSGGFAFVCHGNQLHIWSMLLYSTLHTVKTKVCFTYFLVYFSSLHRAYRFWYVMHSTVYVLYTHKGMKYKLEIYFKLQEIHFKY